LTFIKKREGKKKAKKKKKKKKICSISPKKTDLSFKKKIKRQSHLRIFFFRDMSASDKKGGGILTVAPKNFIHINNYHGNSVNFKSVYISNKKAFSGHKLFSCPI
jgi:hypothetical protein